MHWVCLRQISVHELTSCPECENVAEIIDRFVLESTDGPIEHVRVRCLSDHHFLMPTGSLYAWMDDNI